MWNIVPCVPWGVPRSHLREKPLRTRRDIWEQTGLQGKSALFPLTGLGSFQPNSGRAGCVSPPQFLPGSHREWPGLGNDGTWLCPLSVTPQGTPGPPGLAGGIKAPIQGVISPPAPGISPPDGTPGAPGWAESGGEGPCPG